MARDADEKTGSAPPLDFTPIALTPGTLVGQRFEIKGTIGRGPSAIVYRALDRADQVEVALKILLPRLAFDRELYLKLLRELRTATEIFHPRFVNIRNADEWNGTIYMAMEAVDGRPLKGDVDRRGALQRGQALRITYEVAQALMALHKEHISHRDVWPRNVVVEHNLEVKLMDFAGSRARAILGKTGLSEPAAYLPPEECDPRLHGDSRADVYNLGCMLFELLTGRSPFPVSLQAGDVAAHRRPDAPDLRQIIADCPDWIAELVAKALSLNVTDRHADIAAFVADLEAVAMEADISEDVEALIKDMDRKKKARAEREAAFAKEIPPPLQLPESETKRKAAVRTADYSPAQIAKQRRTWMTVAGIFAGAIVLPVMLYGVSRLVGGGGGTPTPKPTDPGKISVEERVRLSLDGFRDGFPGDDEGHLRDLVALGAPAMEPVRRAIGDPSADVRVHVARALGTLGADDAREELEQLAADGELRVRLAALAALTRATSVSPGIGEQAVRSSSAEEQRAGLALMARGLVQLPGEALAPLMASGDVSLRLSTVGALARAKAIDGPPLLGKALQDPSPAVRAAAATSLASFASEDTAVALLPSLEDVPQVALAAAQSLAVSMPPAMKEQLAEKAVADMPKGEAPLLAVALVRAGHEPLTGALRAGVASTEPGARAHAAHVLSLAGDRATIPLLEEALKSRTTRPAQRPILVALARLDVPSATARLASALTSRDDARAAFAASALAETGNPALRKLLEKAYEAARPGPPKRTLAMAMARLGSVPAGFDAHLASPSREERRDAVMAFALAGDGTRLDRILAIRAEEPEIIEHDVALGHLGHRATLDAYLAMLGKGPVDREKAAEFFGMLGERRYLDRLLPLMRDERPAVRGATYTALASLGDPRGLPFLRGAVADPDPEARTAAVTALYLMGDEAIVDRTAADLKSAKPDERAAACRRLASLQSPLAIPHLIPLLKDTARLAGGPRKRPEDLPAAGHREEVFPRVVDEAAAALQAITGFDGGFTPFAFDDAQLLTLERLRSVASERDPAQAELL